MNENTEFDWEWAKRGGVCITHDGTIIIYSQRGALEVNKYPNSVDGDCDFFWGMPRKGVTIEEQAYMSELSMATPAECAAAGIEYIERHVGADELVELCKDKKRIDWLIEHSDMFYYRPAKCEYCVSHYFLDTTDEKVVYAKNPREAIDAAMKGEKNE